MSSWWWESIFASTKPLRQSYGLQSFPAVVLLAAGDAEEHRFDLMVREAAFEFVVVVSGSRFPATRSPYLG